MWPWEETNERFRGHWLPVRRVKTGMPGACGLSTQGRAVGSGGDLTSCRKTRAGWRMDVLRGGSELGRMQGMWVSVNVHVCVVWPVGGLEKWSECWWAFRGIEPQGR